MVITSFSFVRNAVNFNVDVVCYGSMDIADQWELTDTHQGGVTIKNRHADRNSYAYAIPQQCTLAELSRDYASRGVENPSRQAYQSLQDQLMRDLDAGDYGFKVSADLNGVALLDGYDPGFGFDWSIHDKDPLEDAAKEVFTDHVSDDVYAEAKKYAGVILERSGLLKALAAE